VTGGRRGRLIALEGGEACGKSTQAALLAAGLGAVLTREPGGTTLGERVRSLVLGPAEVAMAARAEALLLAGARAQHVAEVIGPALAAGRDVVTDRFSGSTLAYQGFGRGLDLDELRRLCEWAAGGLWPDLNILLVSDRPLGPPRPPDRMEAEDGCFHRRVAQGYASLAASDPSAWAAVGAEGTVEEVAARVLGAVQARWPGWSR